MAMALVLDNAHCTCIKLCLLHGYVQVFVACENMIKNFRGSELASVIILLKLKDLINSCFSMYRDA